MSSTQDSTQATPKWVVILSIAVAGIMIAGASAHVVSPEASQALIPEFVPPGLAHALAVAAELSVAALIIMPRFRRIGLLAFSVLMILFLPIHVVDAMREEPVMGSKVAAWVRIAVQVVFIWLGYFLSARVKKSVKR